MPSRRTASSHVHLEVWRNDEPVDPATLGLEVTEPDVEGRDAH